MFFPLIFYTGDFLTHCDFQLFYPMATTITDQLPNSLGFVILFSLLAAQSLYYTANTSGESVFPLLFGFSAHLIIRLRGFYFADSGFVLVLPYAPAVKQGPAALMAVCLMLLVEIAGGSISQA